MKRVKVELIDQEYVSKEELDNTTEFIFNNLDLGYLNLFNDKYMIELGISNRDKTFVLVEIIDNQVYIEKNSIKEFFNIIERYLNGDVKLNMTQKKIYLAIVSLTHMMIKEKVIKTSDREIKINLNHKPYKHTVNKVEIKDYKYAKKEYQGRPYNKSNKVWKVRGHFRNVKGTLHWIASYDKQFI